MSDDGRLLTLGALGALLVGAAAVRGSRVVVVARLDVRLAEAVGHPDCRLHSLAAIGGPRRLPEVVVVVEQDLDAVPEDPLAVGIVVLILAQNDLRWRPRGRRGRSPAAPDDAPTASLLPLPFDEHLDGAPHVGLVEDPFPQDLLGPAGVRHAAVVRDPPDRPAIRHRPAGGLKPRQDPDVAPPIRPSVRLIQPLLFGVEEPDPLRVDVLPTVRLAHLGHRPERATGRIGGLGLHRPPAPDFGARAGQLTPESQRGERQECTDPPVRQGSASNGMV